MPGTTGLDTLKAEALKQGQWRQGSDGYIEKGPFPQEKTQLNITVQNVNAESGETTLSLTPRNAGNSPIVHVASSIQVSTQDPKVEDLDAFITREATLYFLVVDSEGRFETGEPQRWMADLKVRHAIKAIADQRQVELACVPHAKMTYTLDGSNPKEGTPYQGPFTIPPQAAKLMVFAISGEATHLVTFSIPSAQDKQVQIEDAKPAKLSEGKKVTLDNTEKVFGVINYLKPHPATLFKGVTLQIGEGENTVSVRFAEREISASILEKAIFGLRSALGNEQESVVVQIRSGASFENGFDIKEFAKLAGIVLQTGDVIQDI